MDIGGEQSRLLLKLMSATSLRGSVIASNIANQNVPGYKRQFVRFEELLNARIARGEGDLAALQPEVVTDTTTSGGIDGNNVNLEQETNAARENRLLFELYATIFQGRMELIHSAIMQSR